MIFRKPYAFLIKYFRLINMVLAVLAMYISYRSYQIIGFFNDYIDSNYLGFYYEGFANSYVSSFVYFIIILIILGLGGILLLLINKKKPIKTYLVSAGYYILFFIFLIFIRSILVTLETSVINAETARIYRDLSIISFIPQFVLIILFLIRAFGFNLKSFNFQEDIKDLKITSEDSEEVEITFNSDNTKLLRNIRRFIREFTYYVKENKFVFSVICVLLVVGIGFLIYRSLPTVLDKNYRQGDTFVVSGINFKIEDSIVTNLDYKGDVISKDKYYVVARLYVENNTNEDYNINLDNFRLVLNKDYVYPTREKSFNFIDYSKDALGTKIKYGKSAYYTLVYEINPKDLAKNYDIKVSDGVQFANGLQVGKFNYIAITPTLLDRVTTVREYQLNDKVSLASSNLNNTFLKVKNSEICDKYIYDYEVCQNDECMTYKDQISVDVLKNDKTLLILGVDFELDQNIPFYTANSNISSFANNFLKIRYLKDSKTVYSTVKNVTPSKLKNTIVLEVTKEVKDTHNLDLAIIVRNKEYIIKLK